MIWQDHKGYKWSSFQEYINNKKNSVIDREEIMRYCKIKPFKYKQFALEGIDKKPDIFSKVYAGFILGKAKFIKDTLKDLKLMPEGK